MTDLTPIQAFSFEDHDVRVVLTDEPEWVAADVCAVLGYGGGSRNAVARLPERMKGVAAVNTPGGVQQMTTVRESGLYRLIFRSEKDSAERFQDWLAEEVLPTIRKTGGYGRQVALPASYQDALRELAAQIDKREELEAENDTQRMAIEAQATILTEQEPIVEAWRRLVNGRGEFPVATVAQAFGTGQNRMFVFLREHGVLISGSSRHNFPRQEHIDAGRFRLIEGTRRNADGDDVTTFTTRVTPKGVDYIARLVRQHGRP